MRSKSRKVSVSTNPTEEFNIKDLFSEESGKKNKNSSNTNSNNANNLNTSDTSSLAGAIELLNIIIKNFNVEFYPYIEQTEHNIAYKYIKIDDYNESIRIESVRLFPNLIEVLKNNYEKTTNNTNNTLNYLIYSKKYLSEVLLNLDKEQTNQVIVNFLDSIGGIVEKSANKFLNTQEIKLSIYQTIRFIR